MLVWLGEGGRVAKKRHQHLPSWHWDGKERLAGLHGAPRPSLQHSRLTGRPEEQKEFAQVSL